MTRTLDEMIDAIAAHGQSFGLSYDGEDDAAPGWEAWCIRHQAFGKTAYEAVAALLDMLEAEQGTQA